MGMAHRGRLNTLANIIGKSYRQIFNEFEGNIDPDTTQGSGDVKSHVGATGKFVGRSGLELPVTLSANPSHLEAVDPVVEGMVRAKQDLIGDPEAFGIRSGTCIVTRQQPTVLARPDRSLHHGPSRHRTEPSQDDVARSNPSPMPHEQHISVEQGRRHRVTAHPQDL